MGSTWLFSLRWCHIHHTRVLLRAKLTYTHRPSDYVELYPARPSHNGSYERLPNYRSSQLLVNYATPNRVPRRAIVHV
jgi:hypothetical protein